MQISWTDLGKPDRPGQYPWRGAMVQVDAKHIELWREHPEARYTLVPFQGMTGGKRYLLGSVEYDD